MPAEQFFALAFLGGAVHLEGEVSPGRSRLDMHGLFLRAQSLRERGDFVGALQLVETLVRQEFHLEALRLRGELLLCLERHAEAAENQKRIEEGLDPLPGLLQEGHYLEAAEAIARMGTGDPAFKSNLERLIRHLDLCLDPEDGVARPQPGQAPLDWFAYAVRRLLKVSPRSQSLHLLLGNLLFEMGQVAESELQYRVVLRHNLSHVPALFALGKVSVLLGKLRDALLAYSKLLDLSPGPQVHESLGEVYFMLDQPQEAVKNWLQAANGYREQDKGSDAVRLLHQVLRADPTNAEALRSLSGLQAWPQSP